MRRALVFVSVGLVMIAGCGGSGAPAQGIADPSAGSGPLVTAYVTPWGVSLSCPPDDAGLLGTVAEQERVPELQEPITEADAVQVVRDLVRRRGFDGPVTSSEMYAIEASGEDLVSAVVAPWEPGTAEPIGAYFEFTGSVLTKSDACTSFLHGSPAE